jgi:pseudaminic acid cytidylyltransferase
MPRKNLRLLDGHPLLAYTVDAAMRSARFDRVVVSTDDPEIAECARRAGAEVPFLRDARVSDDHTPVSAVTVDALERLDPKANTYDVVAQLLPTCPLRTADDVRRSHDAFVAREAAYQISVTRYGSLNPWWALRLSEDATIVPLFEDALARRSQDLSPLFAPTGAIWWATTDALRRSGTFYGPGVRGFELDWRHAVDIDNEEDFQLARVLLAMRREEAPHAEG